MTACFKAGATAADGCEDIREPKAHKKYLDLVSNPTLASLFAENLTSLGVHIDLFARGDGGSTDMGNVSYEVPAIHPFYKIGTGEANHTSDFTTVANKDESHAQTLLAAKAMAYMCIDVLIRKGALEEMKESFRKSMGK